MNPKSLFSGLILAAALTCALTIVFHSPAPATVHAADKPSASAPATPVSANWDRQAAARYLDSRQVWWQAWDRTQKDHGTYCISCHTQAMYALARPALRQDLAEPAAAGAERAMIDSVEKRVHLWSQFPASQVLPFYDDEKYGKGKEIESRNAESVLNAVILSSYDQGQGHLSPTTRLAFENAWALQSTTGPDAGAWVWQNFNYTPWESPESQYHWAALSRSLSRRPGYRFAPRPAHRLPLKPLRRPATPQQSRRAVGRALLSIAPHRRSATRPDRRPNPSPACRWRLERLRPWRLGAPRQDSP